MTNREWLRSLTDNELAEIFCDNDLGNICNICAYRDDRKGCMDAVYCEDGVSEWLKQEHKETAAIERYFKGSVEEVIT